RVFLIDERIGLDDEVRIVYRSITRNWKGDVLDVNYTFGTQGIVKRHQSKLNTAIKDITSLLEGKIQLPYSVLDDAVKNATKALQDAQTQLIFSDNGILAVDKNNPNLVTLFNSAGIGVSKDGGATFGQALTGQGLNVDYVYTGTMLADRIAGGILSSLNGSTIFNLNDGVLEMESTEFRLDGGALIQFLSSGNRLRYTRNNRHAGLAVGTSINDTYPFVALGATNLNQPFNITDEAGFSGFIANTNARTTADGIGNSSVGDVFQVRDNAVSYNKGFQFDLRGSDNFRMRPISGGSYNYWLGASDNHFNGVYTNQLRTNNGFFAFRNSSSSYLTQGFRMDTIYDGDDQLYFRGIHSDDYHSLGRPGGWRFRNLYLRYQPDVSSDERLKTGIKDIDNA